MALRKTNVINSIQFFLSVNELNCRNFIFLIWSKVFGLFVVKPNSCLTSFFGEEIQSV